MVWLRTRRTPQSSHLLSAGMSEGRQGIPLALACARPAQRWLQKRLSRQRDGGSHRPFSMRRENVSPQWAQGFVSGRGCLQWGQGSAMHASYNDVHGPHQH